jgi:endonuclease YncB( thermonuclease family)
MFKKCMFLLTEVEDVSFDDWKDELLFAKVLSCYDGDTCTVKIRRNGRFFKEKVRMYGYDSPEMKPSKDMKNRDEHVHRAILAREALVEKCEGKYVWLECKGKDKYGRILAEIYLPTLFGKERKSINQWMMENGHGIAYDGGTKKEWNFE